MNKNIFLVAILIISAAILRFLPHPPNMTPVSAMALAGGMYIGRKYLAFIIPLITLYLSDLVINNTLMRGFMEQESGLVLWSDYMLYTYIAFCLIVLLGFFFKKLSRTQKILGGALTTAVLFFLFTNFGVWASSGMYPKDIMGLIACYAAGIPYFWNSLIGDLVFIGLTVLIVESSPAFSKSYSTEEA